MGHLQTLLSRREVLSASVLAVGSGMIAGCDASAAAPPADLQVGSIDAHVHVWTPDTRRYPLAAGYAKEQMALPSFTPEEFFAHARPAGVTRTVLIQMSYYGFDNSYMLDTLRAHQGVFSGVARVDETTNPESAMRALARQGVRGFRIVAGTQAPDRWLGGEAMAAMWQCAANDGLAICPLMNPAFLPALDAMCRRFPETPVAVDHFARIGTDGQIRDRDVEQLCALARSKRVRVKLSAFYALGQKKSPYLDLAPMIRRLLDAFGPERLMWASDCPFQVMGGHRYQDSIDLIRQRLDFLSATDRDWLLRRSAEQLFFP
jgi:predicted TIM-barrel fold metal-dependent hydrolase